MIEESGTSGALVSIVICAYNNWPDVEMTIESALHQSHQPTEVIVVDNSSTDETASEVQKRFGNLIRYISQPNKENAGAYNAGFAAAAGEYIQFVDGDDVLAPNKIAKQLSVFETKPNADIVYGDVRQFQTGEGPATWDDIMTHPEDDILKEFIAPPAGWTGIGTLGALFRRRAMEKVGPWDEDLYVEDLDYWLRAAILGCSFEHCPGSPMGFMRRHARQKTANHSAMNRGLDEVFEKALGYISYGPYRSLILARLAEHRYRMAIERESMDAASALAKLKLARVTDPQRVSTLAYALGWVAIKLPGGSFLVRSQTLGALRRFLASVSGFHRSAH
jgi:glycosyltransferase involved in cell wall biosynthesis